MKKLIIIVALALMSCNREGQAPSKPTKHYVGEFINPLETIEIEGCEYLYGDWGKSTVLVHKGNCKNPIHPEHIRK